MERGGAREVEGGGREEGRQVEASDRSQHSSSEITMINHLPSHNDTYLSSTDFSSSRNRTLISHGRLVIVTQQFYIID